MTYIEPVAFTSTNNYGCGPDEEDDVYTVEEFRQKCETGLFIDYDGFGHPVKNKFCDPSIWVYPSDLGKIPADATHIR